MNNAKVIAFFEQNRDTLYYSFLRYLLAVKSLRPFSTHYFSGNFYRTGSGLDSVWRIVIFKIVRLFFYSRINNHTKEKIKL